MPSVESDKSLNVSDSKSRALERFCKCTWLFTIHVTALERKIEHTNSFYHNIVSALAILKMSLNAIVHSFQMVTYSWVLFWRNLDSQRWYYYRLNIDLIIWLFCLNIKFYFNHKWLYVHSLGRDVHCVRNR